MKLPRPVKVKPLVRGLLDWFSANARPLPWRQTCDPYAIWVSEIMLQQTQVKTVIPYWERWMAALPTLKHLAKASSRRLHKLWEGLGYYTRVRNLQRAAQVIQDTHGGAFPIRFEDVLALPGIGRYTAGAICSIAFNQPTPILDGNVIRVLSRIFAVGGDPRKTPANEVLWSLADKLVRTAGRVGRPGATACSSLNQAMMELGAVVCTPQTPRCDLCPVAAFCVAFRQDSLADFPGKRARPGTRNVKTAAFVLRKNGRFLVRQRPDGVANGHLWEFPTLELQPARTNPKAAAKQLFAAKPGRLTSLLVVKHSITRNRITLGVWEVEFAPGSTPKVEGGTWVSRSQLRQLPMPSAHRKIARHVLLQTIAKGLGKG